MILSDFITEIKFEAQIENDTDWASRLYAILSEEFCNFAIETKDQMLHVSQYALSSSDQDATTKLVRMPADFVVEDRVEFRDANSVEWQLPSKRDIVPPALVSAKPKCYEIYGSEYSTGSALYKSSIRLFPAPYTLLANEKVLVSYYRNPIGEITSGTNGNTVLYPFSWLGALRKKVVARIHTYHVAGRAEKAQLLTASSMQTEKAILPEGTNNPVYDSPRNA